MLFRSNDTATTEIYTLSDTLSLHDALPISSSASWSSVGGGLGVRPPLGEGVPSARNLAFGMTTSQYTSHGGPSGWLAWGTASATQTATGGPPPCHVITLDLLSSAMALALRSTWHPLSNHPNEPLAPKKAVGPWGTEAMREQLR